MKCLGFQVKGLGGGAFGLSGLSVFGFRGLGAYGFGVKALSF